MKSIGERMVAAALAAIILLTVFGGWIYVRFFAPEFVPPDTRDPKAEIVAFVRENEDLLFESMELSNFEPDSDRLDEIAASTLLDSWSLGKDYSLCHTDFCSGTLSISCVTHEIVYCDEDPARYIERGEWTADGDGRSFNAEGYMYYLEEIGNGFYYLYYST